MEAQVQITMMGASGTGKTTTLTAIHEQFKPITEKLNIELEPEEETKAILDANLDLLKNLEKVIVSGEFESKTRDKTKAGLSGTASMSPESLPLYQFNLKTKEGKDMFSLKFRDYPGGYIKQERKFVKDLLQGSDSVILTIDTPAMLERSEKPGYAGVWHQLRNQPDEILETFKAAYTNNKGNKAKLVILSPVKCEKYLQSEQGIKNLFETTENVYKELLNFLADSSRCEQFVVLFAPIQTVGCLHFSRVEEKDGPRFKFRLKETGAKYKPECTDQLLIYLLRFLFKQTNEKSLWVNSPTARLIRGLLNHDTVLEQQLKELTKLSQNDRMCGFRIIQGSKLFSLKSPKN